MITVSSSTTYIYCNVRDTTITGNQLRVVVIDNSGNELINQNRPFSIYARFVRVNVSPITWPVGDHFEIQLKKNNNIIHSEKLYIRKEPEEVKTNEPPTNEIIYNEPE